MILPRSEIPPITAPVIARIFETSSPSLIKFLKQLSGFYLNNAYTIKFYLPLILPIKIYFSISIVFYCRFAAIFITSVKLSKILHIII